MKQTYYNEWGRRKLVIDWLNPRHHLSRITAINIIKKLKNIQDICEIGCGVGILSNQLGKLGYKVDGYDIDKKAINIASAKKSRNTNFIAKDIFKLKTKKRYDVVVSSAMLEHVKDDVQALKNMTKILKKNRFLVLIVPINMKYWTSMDKKWGHYRRYTKKELQEKLKKAGFSVEYSRYYCYPFLKWFYFNVFLKAAEKRENLIKGSHIPLRYFGLLLIRPMVYFDALFNSPKATNIILIAKKI